MSQTSLPVPHDRERDELRDLRLPLPGLEPGHAPISETRASADHAQEAGQLDLITHLDAWCEAHVRQAVLVLWLAFWTLVLAAMLYPLFAAVIGGAR